MKRIALSVAILLPALVGFAEEPEPGAQAQRFFARHDTNGDGRVTRAEFSDRPIVFNRIDRDRDGAIALDELQRANEAARQIAQESRLPAAVELLSDVDFGEGRGDALRLDALWPKERPARPMPAIVFIHGGGWSGGDKRSALTRLTSFAQAGYFCASINYRLSGEAPFPAQIEDCKCAIRFLRSHAGELHLDPQRIGVWGESAGGHLAALVGASGGAKELEGQGWTDASSRVQAVCDWFGPTDLTVALSARSGGTQPVDTADLLTRFLGGPIGEKREQAVAASPVAYATADDPPFLILHGSQDPLVPFSQSVLLRNALEKAGAEVELVALEGAGHGGAPFDSPETLDQVLRFFDKRLKGEEPPKKQ